MVEDVWSLVVGMVVDVWSLIVGMVEDVWSLVGQAASEEAEV